MVLHGKIGNINKGLDMLLLGSLKKTKTDRICPFNFMIIEEYQSINTYHYYVKIDVCINLKMTLKYKIK